MIGRLIVALLALAVFITVVVLPVSCFIVKLLLEAEEDGETDAGVGQSED